MTVKTDNVVPIDRGEGEQGPVLTKAGLRVYVRVRERGYGMGSIFAGEAVDKARSDWSESDFVTRLKRNFEGIDNDPFPGPWDDAEDWRAPRTMGNLLVDGLVRSFIRDGLWPWQVSR